MHEDMQELQENLEEMGLNDDDQMSEEGGSGKSKMKIPGKKKVMSILKKTRKKFSKKKKDKTQTGEADVPVAEQQPAVADIKSLQQPISEPAKAQKLPSPKQEAATKSARSSNSKEKEKIKKQETIKE